jgi:hypothetical protein
MNENEFFEAFEAERWNLTFMDETDTTKPVQQVGLVAAFYLVDAYLPIRRKHIAEAFKLYDECFGDKLKSGYRPAASACDNRRRARSRSRAGTDPSD